MTTRGDSHVATSTFVVGSSIENENSTVSLGLRDDSKPVKIIGERDGVRMHCIPLHFQDGKKRKRREWNPLGARRESQEVT